MIRVASLGMAATFSPSFGIETPQRALPAPREDFYVHEDVIFCNTGGLGPSPIEVVQKSVADWEELSADPSVNYYGGISRAKVDLAIEKTASYMNCPVNQTFMTTSTTDGINVVMEGLMNSGTLSPGDHVLTSNFEHPGGLAAMLHYESLGLITVDYVDMPLKPESIEQVLDLIQGALTNRTTVFMISHITQMTGLLFPIPEITDLLHENGVYVIVDGAHSFGIHVDVQELKADAFITSAHKWLLGPSGTGVLCFNHGLGSSVLPVRLSSNVAGGVVPVQSQVAVGYAVDYLKGFGSHQIEAYNMANRNKMYTALLPLQDEVEGFVIQSAPPSSLFASMILTFSLPTRINSGIFASQMKSRYGIELREFPFIFWRSLFGSPFHKMIQIWEAGPKS